MDIDLGMKLTEELPDLIRLERGTTSPAADQSIVLVVTEVMAVADTLVDGIMVTVELVGMIITETESK